ncbi:MAG TPA: hypothetical protein VIM73_20080 [Polyangiaceae bacterium]
MKHGRAKWFVAMAPWLSLYSGEALAQPGAELQPPIGPPAEDASELEAPMIWPLEPVLERNPGWSIGIDAYAGFAVVSTADGGYSHALVGGLSRFQWHYLQFGGFIETTDGGEHHWRSIGGFAGAFIPFRHWVDFEFAAGVASRRYREDSSRYGPDGYEATSPALTLRAGFSDRSIDGLFGLRLGGHLAAAFDLERHERSWRYEFETSDGELRTVAGSTKVGGFSVGLAVTAGFDIGKKP